MQDRVHSLAQPNLADFTRSEVREYFLNSYELYEVLFSAIADEKFFYKSPDRLRLPLIFYLGHTASVYVNKLLLAGLIQKRVNMTLETVFELGVDEMSWDDTENYRLGGAFQWPSVQEVMTYRKQVSKTVLDVIDNAPFDLPVTQDHPWWAVFMGIEHERIHLNTSSVLLNQLPVNMLKRPSSWKYAPPSSSAAVGQNELVKVSPRQVVLGKTQNFPSFGWDNEYGQATVDVPEFEASKYLVSNREYLTFVEDGGYQRKELWTEEGWNWVSFRQAKHPIFWVCSDGCRSGCGDDLADYSHCTLSVSNGIKFRYRALFDVIDMPWDWPVVANYLEMKAFCRWKGPQYRAPTEAEHQSMRALPDPDFDVNSDPAFNLDYPGNMHLKYGSPSPVNMFDPSPTGHYDLHGNLWEWVEDHFNGLPDFQSTYLYDDFSSPFFDGKHNLIMGGSWISTGDETSRFNRTWFRRHFFQHAGFRYVVSSHATPVRLCKTHDMGAMDLVSIPNVTEECFHEANNEQFQYETQQSLETVLRREYGNVDDWAGPVLEVVETMLSKHQVPRAKAVVLGSAGGVTTFLLTTHFSSVRGVDFSGKFVEAAQSIQQGHGVEYGDGEMATLPTLEGMDPKKVVFQQFTWIPNEVVSNDLVLFECADRLNEPTGWFRKLWETVSPQGIVIIMTSAKYNRQSIQNHISKWFVFLEEFILPEKLATVWKLADS